MTGQLLPSLLIALTLGACQGDVIGRAGLPGAPGMAGNVGSSGAAGDALGSAGGAPCAGGTNCQLDPTSNVMRRLNRLEYDKTVADLVRQQDAFTSGFPSEEIVKSFNNNASALSFPPLLAEQAIAAAERTSEMVVERRAAFAPCAASSNDAACASAFIKAFGAQAWRRPLTSEEITRLQKVYGAGAGTSFERGLALVVQSVLIAAPFFYRVELGDGKQVTGKPAGTTRPTSWEMATRLSYLLWGTMPDAKLMELAQADQLQVPEVVLGQAERLLVDERARTVLRTFHEQWLHLGQISAIAKDPQRFSSWNNAYPKLLLEGARSFVTDVAASGTFSDLFSSDFLFVNDELASYYGIPAPGSTAFVKVQSNDPNRGAGILTQGGLLAALSGFASTSPTFRGRFIREQLLCGELPPPPADVNVMIGVAEPTQTTRQHYLQHISNPSCSGCHSLMDPLGFAFEGYDAIGNFRTEENGQPVDASGEAPGSDLGTFNGLSELGASLSGSEDVRRCIAKQGFRFAVGRLETEADSADLTALTELVRTRGSFASFLRQLVQSDAFLYLANK